MNTLLVIAGASQVPLEGRRNRWITSTPVTVPDTVYYRRRLASGELVLAPPAVPDAPPAKSAPATPSTLAE